VVLRKVSDIASSSRCCASAGVSRGSAATSFGTDNFAQTYFGVTPEESDASGLDPYNASGGLLGAGVELGARYLFNERWGLEGAASWNVLVNDAADSPVTATGSEDQYQVRLGITRSVSLDF
jgi:outer membrane scaffolding protein for murein synthesis (MipA/OmpV family)